MSDTWNPDRFANIDWAGFNAEPRRTCAGYAEFVGAWLDAETDTTKKEALEVLSHVLALQIMWDPSEGEDLGPTHVLGSLPRAALISLVANLGRISSAELRARIADAAWLARRACSPEVAARAAHDYLTAAQAMFDPQQWTDSFTRLRRAMRLSVSLGRKQQPFLAISNAALGMLRQAAPGEPLYFSLRVIELLLEHRVGEASELAELAIQVASQSEAAGDLHRARSYLERAESCWKRAKNPDRVEACVRLRAQLLEREAASWAESDETAIQADGLIEQAIKAYQSLAGTSSEVARLKAELQRVRAVAVKQFKQVDGGTIDLSEQAEKASGMVRGKPVGEALIALAALACPTPLQRLRQAAVATLESSPFLAMIKREKLSLSGRVVHRRPGIAEGDGEAAIVGQIHEAVTMHHRAFAIGAILPALRQIQAEHGLRLEDLHFLAQRSLFVPPGRETAFAKGLAAGLAEDFFTSGHLLVPQFEHAVRWHLNRLGVTTVTLPPGGIQNEIDLGALFEKTEIGVLFDEASLFDLKSLLTEKAGTNLRNEVAHGLVEPGERENEFMYLLWVVIRCMVAPWLNHLSARAAESTVEQPKS